MNREEIILGVRDVWDTQVSFGISPEDQRHHTYIIGKTGSGKVVCVVTGGNIDLSKFCELTGAASR